MAGFAIAGTFLGNVPSTPFLHLVTDRFVRASPELERQLTADGTGRLAVIHPVRVDYASR
ncbi:uncharacterized membrane protein YbaN (DUF454 family) [Ensifer adhaerens]|uniref:Uncharacterized membrane protein YbaN (DUF454 family) n=1 Tax=Ensifer adhaerens TaxID=106592 RepID=A0ACC5SSL9_ENSAD|nr:hypothetical protein [Ensifer adhaerens]MBP1871661.1 uncharacterized membrane protein YbaN (DUF454 family) [Ensifer adhaerens]